MLPSLSRSIFDRPRTQAPAPFGLVLPRRTKAVAAVIPASRDRFGNVIVVMFLIAQMLDFIFTYLGVAAFGVREGNPLLEHSMRAMGLGTSLAIAKLVAVAGAATLHLLAFHRLLASLTIIYLALAILPWTWVLFVMN
jgi:hypothetical protein